ncbi:hypothetical protein MJT46_006124 [Ovis ammon polii x Ovis aries]|nr:hypothetical protein MJT46_006124 [Ovis ammon polii x Ovis aries]
MAALSKAGLLGSPNSFFLKYGKCKWEITLQIEFLTLMNMWAVSSPSCSPKEKKNDHQWQMAVEEPTPKKQLHTHEGTLSFLLRVSDCYNYDYRINPQTYTEPAFTMLIFNGKEIKTYQYKTVINWLSVTTSHDFEFTEIPGMLRHQYISFKNFVGSDGAPQAVFTFLLIPCCLALDFTAPPLIPNIPFLWAWNAPTDRCGKIFDMPPDLSLFSLVGTPQKDVTGQLITLFYADRLGYYPYINERTGVHKNGGIPQVGSLKKHLDKAEKDITYYMPINNVGLAVIDWENWRPTWARNWKPKHVYKNESIKLVLQQNTHLPLEEAAKRAKADFEKAAKSFMQETLKLGKLLRPKRLWGYYLFPDCYNHRYNQPSYNGSCFDVEKRRNDALNWLWKESTALYPSIYLNTKLKSSPQAALFVRNRVQEAIRMSKIASVKSPLPVFVYTRPVFTDKSSKFLSQDDLVNTIGESIALGASGIIMWGSFNLSLTRSKGEGRKEVGEKKIKGEKRILDPGQEIEFVPPALGVQSLNCWTGREVPENHHS